MEGQRPGDRPAQGNALGKTANISPALKGRHRRCSAPSGLILMGLFSQGVALGWHVCAPLVLLPAPRQGA